MTVRLIRTYTDGWLHGYREDQVTDPEYRYLVPVCQENRFYPERHDREMISSGPIPKHSDCAQCPGCGVWFWRNPVTIVEHGEVFR